ncbi:hypothetical protein LZ32DRAFT_92342 [Colletotrichum eremochloae]|nr:hypothetical protein LZ32DRAFT_92342 [Colletotrichum eremochloae]
MMSTPYKIEAYFTPSKGLQPTFIFDQLLLKRWSVRQHSFCHLMSSMSPLLFSIDPLKCVLAHCRYITSFSGTLQIRVSAAISVVCICNLVSFRDVGRTAAIKVLLSENLASNQSGSTGTIASNLKQVFRHVSPSTAVEKASGWRRRLGAYRVVYYIHCLLLIAPLLPSTVSIICYH